MRKCTRPSPLYCTASDEKLGLGLGTRLHLDKSPLCLLQVTLQLTWPSGGCTFAANSKEENRSTGVRVGHGKDGVQELPYDRTLDLNGDHKYGKR